MTPCLRRLVLAIVLLSLPMGAHAQSTALGRNLFSAFDVWWEHQQARNPWLRQIDNTDAKTWLLHGAITALGGYTIGKLTPLSTKAGLRIMATFYVTRELYNISVEGNHKYGDATMDALVPLMVATLRVQVVLR